MPLHDKAFWFISFFLSGVLAASVLERWQSRMLVLILLAVFLAAMFLAFGKRWHAILAFGIIVGALYAFVYDARAKNIDIPFGNAEVTGVVLKASVRERSQAITLRLNAPHRGTIRITAERHPTYAYGDELAVAGKIEKPQEQFAARLAKDNVYAVMSFPKEIRVLGTNKGSPVKAALLRVKQGAEATFRRALPPEKAAFLAGLTLGETSGFTQEFRDTLSRTGTSHLVALSGYNIAIVAKGVMGAFAFFFRRRLTFLLGTLAILGFVVMTGAESSVVRAAVMAFLVLLADQAGRLYSFRNSIAIAAFLMVLANPKILVWDVGFQLSFAAVVGLMYVAPAVQHVLRLPPGSGFLHWRENLVSTISAQLAVLPILLAQFGSFSLISLAVNVLVLAFVPVTMFLGFAIAALGALSNYVAIALGYLANIALSYELGVIRIFSRFGGVVEVQSFGVLLALAYYGALAIMVAKISRAQKLARYALPA